MLTTVTEPLPFPLTPGRFPTSATELQTTVRPAAEDPSCSTANVVGDSSSELSAGTATEELLKLVPIGEYVASPEKKGRVYPIRPTLLDTEMAAGVAVEVKPGEGESGARPAKLRIDVEELTMPAVGTYDPGRSTRDTLLPLKVVLV